MKEIKLTKGYIVVVDDEDFEYLSKQKWHAKEAGPGLVYACGKSWQPETKKSLNIKMHRVIMKVDDPKVKVDHIDGNGLNNRKSNLRLCSHSDNLRNQRKTKTRENKWKGVELVSKNNHWAAYACDNGGKKVNLGTHATAEKAAMAYNAYVTENHGKFASLNMTAQYG